MKNLLLSERPLVILPSLAVEIGLNEAIILQQLHYWIKNSERHIDGKKWVYNTYGDWQKQFPFWSKSTIRRSLSSLEKQGLIITGNFNKSKIDKTKWYTINYEKLRGMSSPCVQNEQSMCSNWTHGSAQNEQTNTIEYTENTTDIYKIYDHWNSKKIIVHRKLNQKTRSHINARLQEYSLDELLTAIDNYDEVLKNDKYYWTHRWTLEDFMKPNNVVRFLDESEPFKTFIDKRYKHEPERTDIPPIREIDFSEGEDWN